MAVPVDAGLDAGALASASLSTPPESPLSMPVQDLRTRPSRRPRRAQPGAWLARLFVFGGAIGLTGFGVQEMLKAVEPGGLTALEIAFLCVFAVAFGWIAQSATSALCGLFYRRARPVPPSAGRTAIVMPIYNEDAGRTTAALQAMAEDLAASGRADGMEIFIVSDSTDPDVWVRETVAVQRLRAASALPVWYRRRADNTGKKAGNVKEFVTRWGGRYEFMLVLDADSLMSAEAMLALRDGIAADKDLALLQSTPILAGRRSLFARLQQFAGRIHGPIAARGVAVWSGDDGNFWGHNAIIRVSAFAACCGLPTLPGRKPFGGQIMSHDFVEAALLRRRGWKVRMAPEIEGSWEESPPSLLDSAARDRRWAQGNLQHAGVIGARGLSPINRMHMAIGIMSYTASPLWLLLLTIGIILSAQARLVEPVYFQEAFGLFPNWPRFDAERMLRLFGITMAVLLTPKFLGMFAALVRPRLCRGVGGPHGVIASWIAELVLSALYAPIMLLIQCQQLFEILTGRDSGWSAQQREETTTPWSLVVRRHAWHMTIGVLVGAGALLVSPAIFLWLSPTLVGMVLAAPLSRMSASRPVGVTLEHGGLLLIPEETSVPPIFHRRDEILASAPPMGEVDADGLRAVATDAETRAVYLTWFAHRPAPPRGQADLDVLSAQKKIEEASSLDEAISWFTPGDRRAALGDSGLMEALAKLAASEVYYP
jgi:membrane glycosyltransferase